METTTRPQARENPSTLTSSNSNVCNCASDSINNGFQIPTPPLTPKTISRSESNPYPTTFVQADTSNFKKVVQMLTGSSETSKQASSKPLSDYPPPPPPPHQTKNFFIPPVRNSSKKHNFSKLYERRNLLKNNSLMINTLVPNLAQSSNFSPRKMEILSPSMLDFPKLVLSPVTPLIEDPFNKSPASLNSSEEEKAIAEKGFYLHPSPMNTPRDSEPQLLPLFPVTSPRVSGSSS